MTQPKDDSQPEEITPSLGIPGAKDVLAQLTSLSRWKISGQVTSVMNTNIKIGGMAGLVPIGDLVSVERMNAPPILAEVVGFSGGDAVAFPLGLIDGVRPGASVMRAGPPQIAPSDGWLGHVVDAMGNPIDGSCSTLPPGPQRRSIRTEPPPPMTRKRLGNIVPLGVRAFDAFIPCRRGQRLGIFAGSGVGKSSLVSLLASHAQCDVIIVGLIGERGREVREFWEDTIPDAARHRTLVVAATSDQPPILRRWCAYTAMTLAEHFRDQGKHVVLILDTITRFCHALREVYLSIGEPPSVRGYTPGVFTEIPQLLERAGPGREGTGDITGLFSVLIESDDTNDPIADFIRGILDGHVVMDRALAERGVYPAIDVLKSLSRGGEACLPPEMRKLVREARNLMATWERVADLVRMGAYRTGTDPEVDRAIAIQPLIEKNFLIQSKSETNPIDDIEGKLRACLNPA